MKKGIIGKKIGMTQLFDEKGNVIPVTVINAGPCVVVAKKTADKEGYDSVQLGYQDIAERKLTKPAKGAFKKAGVSYKKYLKEFRLDGAAEMNVGDTVTADTFEAGEKVDVTGVTKGPRLLRCHQEMGRAPPQNDARHGSCPPPGRFDGREQLAFESVQKQEDGRSVRQREGDGAQP